MQELEKRMPISKGNEFSKKVNEIYERKTAEVSHKYMSEKIHDLILGESIVEALEGESDDKE